VVRALPGALLQFGTEREVAGRSTRLSRSRPGPPAAPERTFGYLMTGWSTRPPDISGVATAVTTLRRLESRGLLGRHRVGRAIQYTTVADSAAVTAIATLAAARPSPRLSPNWRPTKNQTCALLFE